MSTSPGRGGLTFNIDTIFVPRWSPVRSWCCSASWPRRALTRDTEDHVPTKLQLFWETVVGQVNTQVEDNLGRVHPYVAPLAISLFFFILFANWLEMLPTELNHDTHLLPAPTADTNLTYALALLVMVSVWTYGIRQKGAEGLLQALPRAVPRACSRSNILEELHQAAHAGAATLRQHLRRRHHAGPDRPAAGLHPRGQPNVSSGSCFDMAIGGIQAFIFALLTVLYFAMAGAGHGDHARRPRRPSTSHDDAETEEQPPFPRPDRPVSSHQR